MSKALRQFYDDLIRKKEEAVKHIANSFYKEIATEIIPKMIDEGDDVKNLRVRFSEMDSMRKVDDRVKNMLGEMICKIFESEGIYCFVNGRQKNAYIYFDLTR